MDFTYLFEPYEALLNRADKAFQRIAHEYPDCISCKRGCSDCCHAVFGLFLVEALFLKYDFDQLERKEREKAVMRADKADDDLELVEKRLRAFENDPMMTSYALAKERIRCPLLNDNHDCVLYPYRPITCRVYGIPVAFQGKARVCGRSQFKKGKGYPAFDLDGVYRELHAMSRQLLENAGKKDLKQASLLISVSKAIRTPTEGFI